MKPTFFATPAEFGAWLDGHHASAPELLVGFYKTGSGRPSMTWPESVDEALCYGWIDGVRRRIDDESYTIRFTPRKPTSIWSLRNVARVEALRAEGRMRPAGLAAFAARTPERTGVYSFEKDVAGFTAAEEAQLRADPAASRAWDASPPSYRRPATHWVTSAKRAETRTKRFAELMEACREGVRVRHLRRD